MDFKHQIHRGAVRNENDVTGEERPRFLSGAHPRKMRILSWNVNGLQTTLKDVAHRYTNASIYFSTVLHADVVCFQEAKVQEEKLEKGMACIPGFESFWAFSQAKKGYSGVVTYVKDDLSPLDAAAESLPGIKSDIEDLCREGRIVETDHGSFVLINVYVPNAGDRGEGRPRLDFKIRFLKALKTKCDDLVRSGRHIVVVGDFNIAHKDVDLHPKWNVEEIYSSEERSWLNDFLMEYVDLFRHFHPDVKDVFSVWEAKTDARIHNEGFRIDYAVCDKGFLPQVKDTQILKMVPKNWSDHAAVVLSLKDQPPLPQHPASAISSRNMKRFQEDRRQKKLTALFSRGASKPMTATATNKIELTTQEEGVATGTASSPALTSRDGQSTYESQVGKVSDKVAEEEQLFGPQQNGLIAHQEDSTFGKDAGTEKDFVDQDGEGYRKQDSCVQKTSESKDNPERAGNGASTTSQTTSTAHLAGNSKVEFVKSVDMDLPPEQDQASDASEADVIEVDGRENTSLTRKRPGTSANENEMAPAKQRNLKSFFKAAPREKESE